MSLITPTRRGFLFGLAGIFAAPALVRATSIMPVKAFVDVPADKSLMLKMGGLRPFGETVQVDLLDQAGKLISSRIVGTRMLIGGGIGNCMLLTGFDPLQKGRP